MEEHGGMTSSARGDANTDRRDGSVEGVSVIGPWLRQHRENSGLSVQDVAQALKLRTSHIEALETEAFDRLPARPYAVGYVRSIADALGLSPQEAVARLHAAWPQQTLRKPVTRRAPAAIWTEERRFPVRAALSLAVVLTIAGYAYWYANKSAEMGRPLLSPVAELEAPADTAEPLIAPAPPAPGPLQLLGVPELAESSDAASAIGEGATENAGLAPLPIGPVPRPRVGTEAAERFAATYALPEYETSEPAAMAAADGARPAPLQTERLPSAESLTAYLPSVRLRSDLGPLRSTMHLPASVPTARTDPSAVPLAEAAPVGRTQAFAAVPPSDRLLSPIGTSESRPRQDTRDTTDAGDYDLMAGLPQFEAHRDIAAADVQILADQSCWIEIHTADGKVLEQRLLQPGERLDVPAQRGLTLTAGNAGGIRILVDGVTAAAIGGTGQVVRGVSLEPHRLLAHR